MLFNSLTFLVFFPVVSILYFLLPQKLRPLWLLLASCYFYMVYVPSYILVLFALITLDFFLAPLIAQNSIHRRAFLWISVAANLGMLGFFKYFNFFNANIAALAQAIHWNYSYEFLSFALPLGLSFHVFQSLSYVIEVYRGKCKPERNYLIYALYVMFFPQLLAGPIERPYHMLPQLHLPHEWDEGRVVRGLERMAWGFFKKLVIADNIAQIVTHVFNDTHLYEGPVLMLVMALFAYQLYCDFSGYSDIAIGIALVLGYELLENFDRPFAAISAADFWRRWHMTLSNWFRDYLFNPLALSWSRRMHRAGIYAAVLVTFLLLGLWHGANWTYVTMGGLFGFYIVMGMLTKPLRDAFASLTRLDRVPALRHVLQIVITFSLMCFAWIFFRAENMAQALGIAGHLGTNLTQIVNPAYVYRHVLAYETLGVTKPFLLVILCAIIALELVQYAQTRLGTRYLFDEQKPAVRMAWYYALVLATLCFGYFGATPFIYFKF